MSDQRSIDCEEFDAHADELALGQLDEPLRSRLLAHAVECAHCHALLDGLGTVVDRLLLAAPQIEPPAGFENRALGRLDVTTGGSTRRRTGLAWAAAGVAAVSIAIVSALVAVRFDDGSNTANAAIVTATGTEVGSVQLIAEPTPHVLVVIDTPRPDSGIRWCELQRPDGTWETVGWWDAADISSGVWAVGIDPALLDATAMRITADDDVLATAVFS
jgi:hypothetical protein